MTPAINRWSILFTVLLLLTGCTGLPAFPPVATGDVDLFASGFDEYLATGELSTLKRVPQEYPKGPWGPRAIAIIAMVEQQQQQSARLKQLEADKQDLAPLKSELEAVEKDRDACQHEKEALVQDNQSLEMTLERLKQVLIDTELQSN